MQRFKAVIRRILSPLAFVKPILETIFQIECQIARYWVSNAHYRLWAVQWMFPPEPEHFDHHIDLFHLWLASKNSMWLERGVFGSLALRGGNVLELCCGDGFNARNFYSLRSKHVIACDFDPKAIDVAKEKNRSLNIKYVVCDIRTDMPEGKFENIIWDAAIEHFTPEEIHHVLRNIKLRLTSDGVLSGHTIVRGLQKSLSHHEYEFKDKEDLLRFLIPYFKHVTVFETIYPNRHNLYFWASDSILPFRDDWPNMSTERSLS